jgi:hypothetical protein
MGLCCSQREKQLTTMGTLLSDETRLAKRLSQLDPPIKHPVIKRYDWSEIGKFLEEAEYNEDAAFRNILEDIVIPIIEMANQLLACRS